ncbi:unnamed protein product [Arabidopsis thaliana]|uniref:Myb family transcription factor n=2 Tax=Arabidopsis TaxID=3701 RepID=Q9LVT0_ARATH|nr:myb family transcription factor [Arabidopsis thaliana]AED95494.1 myb family transcription factor [Arabidopsis thaliana]KAG7611851.1 Homeobox-like domain superfamily [Arabidopsis suecica]BAA97163.1 unnamed protein product [Arabidopsis thaliana]|eukprot:NP_199540.1 myb family transcription factor [Arabidopsis thaliana]
MAGTMKWTWEENKAFEVALVQVPDSPAKLEIIAAQMRTSVDEIKYHYDKLLQDIAVIESGRDVVPEYSPRSATPIVAKKGTRWSAQEHESYDESLI